MLRLCRSERVKSIAAGRARFRPRVVSSVEPVRCLLVILWLKVLRPAVRIKFLVFKTSSQTDPLVATLRPCRARRDRPAFQYLGHRQARRRAKRNEGSWTSTRRIPVALAGVVIVCANSPTPISVRRPSTKTACAAATGPPATTVETWRAARFA